VIGDKAIAFPEWVTMFGPFPSRARFGPRVFPISWFDMADSSDSPLIQSRADLIETLARGNKPKDRWRIGTEHEKFVFNKTDFAPVPYEGEKGIGAILEAVRDKTGWTPLTDKGVLIGLAGPEGAGSISLEPGGQFELSGAALASVHQTCAEAAAHLKLLTGIADPMGIGFLGLGVAPTWSLDEIPVMPKSRYAIMAPYMRKVGTLGTSMMFRSCTVQTNHDFSSEADMVKKMRVSLALQPVVTALFANSPFLDGRPSGFLSFRAEIWRHTDANRTGMLPFVFEDGFGFERYVDYALDVPMYFVTRNGEYIDCAGESFRAFLEGELPQLPGEKPTVHDWEDHVSTIFPDVRLKQFLEMRGADGGPWAEICALPALWTGILYDQSSLDAAWDLVADWTEQERQDLHAAVPRTAIHTPFRNGTVADVARRLLEIAEAGLAARDLRNWEDADETTYLEPLHHILNSGKTRAETLLELYRDDWNGDIARIFTDQAY